MKGLSFRKKIIIILLCVLLAMIPLYSPLPYSSTAHAKVTTSSGLVFENGNITGYEGSSASVTIPATISGQAVKGIVGAFEFNDVIQNVVISEGISTLSKKAFHGCSKLTSISIPASVTYIEAGSLSMCENLTTITVSDTNTKYIVFENALYNTTQTELVQYLCASVGTLFEVPETVEKIHDFAFASSPNLTEVIVPQSTIKIGQGAFANCKNLTSVTVHALNTKYKTSNGVLLSKDGKTLLAYPADKASTSYDISSSIVELAPYSFSGCTNLRTLYFSNSVKIITSAFEGCFSLTKIMVGSGNANYSSLNGVLASKDGSTLIYYPGGIQDSKYNVPSGVTTIGAAAFLLHPHIQSVVLSDSVTTIESLAFFACDKLTELFAPRSVTTFGLLALLGADNLTIFGYPGSDIANYAETWSIPFAAIGDAADWEYTDNGDGTCTLTKYLGSATDVYVPSIINNLWVKKVSYTAFDQCSSVEYLTFYNSITTIEAASPDGTSFIFEDCTSLREVYLPKSFTTFEMHSSPFKPFKGCSSIVNIIVSNSNSSYYDKDGVLFASDNTLIVYPSGKTATSYTIPTGTKNISCFAFYNSYLKEVTVPGSVTTLAKGDEPTFNDNIEKVIIKEGTLAIEDVFLQTKAMNIYFPQSAETITGFDYGDVLHTFYVFENSPAHLFAVEKEIPFVMLCTVTFNSNGGTSVDKIVIPVGSKLTEPKNITKPDHLQSGWFTDEELTLPWSFANDTVTTSMTLHSKWIEGYAIIYHLNGGTNSSKNPSYYVAGTAVTLAKPTKTGYNFDSWYTDPSCALSYEFKGITEDTRGTIEIWADWWKSEPTNNDDDNSGGGGTSSTNIVPSDERKAELSQSNFPASISYMKAGQTIKVTGKIYIKYANVEDISVSYSGNSDKLYKYTTGAKRLTSYNYSHTFTLDEINYNTTDKYLITVRLSNNEFFQHSIPINKYILTTEVLNAPDNVLYMNSGKNYELRSMAIANNTFTTLDITYVNKNKEICTITDNTIVPLAAGIAVVESNVKLSDGSIAKYTNEFTVIDKSISEPSKLERELMCQCYGEFCTGLPDVGIDPALLELIEKIREECDVPVHIISGYRCPDYNRSVGGDKESEHVNGTAADIWADGISVDELYKICDKLNINGGVGKYDSYIHIDTRGVYVRWDEEQGVIDQ